MPSYRIKYIYDTGDSFETHYNEEGILEFTWSSLEIAKENLQYIKEHYDFYKFLKNPFHSKKETKKIIDNAKTKFWYVEKHNEFCLKFKTNNGTPCQIYAPWLGYFETLNEVEIIEDDSDRKISFR